jgi:excisionase family DNA binding protein
MSELLPPGKMMFRIDEVAHFCDVHERTVRNWIESGHLPVVRLPGLFRPKIRITRTTLLKILGN